MKDGNFGGINLENGQSAWQVAARYSSINLNDKDIKGGKEDNMSAAVHWYFNQNVESLQGISKLR